MDTSLFEKRSVEEFSEASCEEAEAECAEHECHDTIPCPPPFKPVVTAAVDDDFPF